MRGSVEQREAAAWMNDEIANRSRSHKPDNKDGEQPLSSRDPALNVQAVVSTHSGKPFAQR